TGDPDEPFHSIEEVDGRRTLRYATADLMRRSCVDCHNTHANTPKDDWVEGDLRGVLEVVVPLSSVGDQMKAMLWKDFLLLAALLVMGFLGLGVTLRKLRDRSREALASAEQLTKLSSALEQSAAQVFITDREGRIEYANPAFLARTGYTLEELAGQTPRMLNSGQHDPALFEELWATILDGRPYSAVFCNRCKDGSLYYEDKTITPLRDRAGEISHFVSTGIDVTEARELEERLRQSQKMEAIGRLAGGVAHDFNNLLTAIIGQAELLELDLDPKNGGSEAIECIKAAADRATVLTRQLLAFSRKQVLQPVVLDLNTLVEASTKMLGRMIGEDVSFVTHPAPDLAHVEADPGQLDQVIMNLAVNARDAMPEGGKLEIETANLHLPEPSRQHPGVPDGEWVVLEVRDSGCGMDSQTQARIFEPFFTSKEQGTGLGLSTVYGIVKQSGGHILVDSEPGVGTRVRIYLPQVSETVATPRPSAPRETLGGEETILVVEDERILWDVIRSTLETRGYTVLLAEDGREALGIVGMHPGHI
ncbi:MAG: ATP-binding protein, partial [Planctomycetota bacterium]